MGFALTLLVWSALVSLDFWLEFAGLCCVFGAQWKMTSACCCRRFLFHFWFFLLFVASTVFVFLWFFCFVPFPYVLKIALPFSPLTTQNRGKRRAARLLPRCQFDAKQEEVLLRQPRWKKTCNFQHLFLAARRGWCIAHCT